MSEKLRIFGSHEHEDESPSVRAQDRPLDIAAARAALARGDGKRFWRSLEELAGTPECEAFLHHEFPNDPAKEPRSNGVARRDILKLMAASAALSGLSACTKLPTEKIVPYVKPPEEIIPGKPLFYATSMPGTNGAMGLLVESHMGRPTKIEGNSEHPGSLGATDIFAQASVLGLYDPDRSQVVVHEGRISDWPGFSTAIANARAEWQTTKGAGLRILTDATTSPTFASQMKALLAQFPEAKWYAHEPCGPYSGREGAELAFGQYVNSVYRFDQADVIVSLDADFLCSGPTSVRYARDFANRRRVENPSAGMNRLYVLETTPSNTGAMADHRRALDPAAIEAFARALAAAVGVPGHGASLLAPADEANWFNALVRDLHKHHGTSLIIVGESQPPAVHALVHAMNQALGNAGKTVVYTDPLEVSPATDGIAELLKEIDAGQVSALVILSSNPVYTAPADLDFTSKFLKVGLRIHLGLYNDETAELCHWHIPEAHFLESCSR
jgi:MoCo/4Fe-4S cofactor protein with predicted Tat translocation signal